MNWWIWIVAAIAYLMFVGWYFNWKGPLKPNEVEQVHEAVRRIPVGRRQTLRFCESSWKSDDGKEFVMLNLSAVS